MCRKHTLWGGGARGFEKVCFVHSWKWQTFLEPPPPIQGFFCTYNKLNNSLFHIQEEQAPAAEGEAETEEPKEESTEEAKEEAEGGEQKEGEEEAAPAATPPPQAEEQAEAPAE